MVGSRFSGVRFLEMILAIACMVLHYKSMGQRDSLSNVLITGTFVGFSIILIASATLGKSIDPVINIIGGVLFIICGALIIQAWFSAFKTDTRSYALVKGSLALINGILFMYDVSNRG